MEISNNTFTTDSYYRPSVETETVIATGGTAIFGNTTSGYLQWYPAYRDYTNPYWWPSGVITVAPVPIHCDGNTHVFACEHADTCKCGKASRVPEPKKCGACGK
jgi:hypothetical protein